MCTSVYRKSRMFRVKNISCDNIWISVNNVHNFHAFNFRIAHLSKNILTMKISRFTVSVCAI